jgi:hypothetical protein
MIDASDDYGQSGMAVTPFIIAIIPVTLVLAIFPIVNFGFYMTMNSITPVWLQKLVKLGGYGFTAYYNAQCKPLFCSVFLE